MLTFLVVAFAVAGTVAYRFLVALLRQIPGRNEDFDVALIGAGGLPAPASRRPQERKVISGKNVVPVI